MDPEATVSLTLWKERMICLFFVDDEGMFTEPTTEELSPNNILGVTIGIPKYLSVFLRSIICSTANLVAINSVSYVDVQTVGCFFEYQDIGVLFKKLEYQ